MSDKHTIEQVQQAFGPVIAKLARQGHWPDADELDYRLGIIEKYGLRKAKGIFQARARYKRREIRERYRKAGFA